MADHPKRPFFLDRRAMPAADPDISRPHRIRDGTFLKEDRRKIKHGRPRSQPERHRHPRTAGQPLECISTRMLSVPCDGGSIKIRGVNRRNRPPSESRTGVRGRRMDVRASMSATLTPRILMLPTTPAPRRASGPIAVSPGAARPVVVASAGPSPADAGWLACRSWAGGRDRCRSESRRWTGPGRPGPVASGGCYSNWGVAP